MDKSLLRNTVLYLLKIAPGLGSVQLRKALIMIDAVYHAFFGKTLTGITYVKHWYGPVPDDEANSELYKMEFKDIRIVHDRGTKGHYALTEPDLSVFPHNKKVLEIIGDVANFVIKSKAKYLSEITHDEVYMQTEMGGVIPIDLVYKIETTATPWTENEHIAAQKAIREMEKDGFDFSPFYA